MTFWMRWGIRRGLLLLGIGMIMTGAATAQPQSMAAGQVYPRAPVQSNSGYELRGYLRALAANPNSLEALIGAGRAALASGDAEASLSFFGRADQISPRNARAKAGMAAALAHLGQAQTSISLFTEAVALGAPEYEIADDRGLAFDMTGDPRRAQQDYALAMRYRDVPKLRRRMALSLAISGQRDAALRLIDAQLRRNDRAAWRTQAFVLALTGDYAGANLTAQLMMPAGTAQAMAPFFARLPALSAAQKARAVHLGQFPNGGFATAGGPARDTTADPGALAMAMGGASGATHARTQQPPVGAATRPAAQAARPSTTPRRRPDTVLDSSDPYNLRNRNRVVLRQQRSTPPRDAAREPVQPASQPPPTVVARWANAGSPSQPSPSLGIQPQPPPSTPPVQPPSQLTQTASRPASEPPSLQASAAVTPPSQSSYQRSIPGQSGTSGIEPSSQPIHTPTAEPAGSAASMIQVTVQPPSAGDTALPARATSSLADIVAVVNALPPETAPPPPARSVQPRTPAPPGAARPAHPARHWVQIAGAANRAGLPSELARLRGLAPDQLGRRAAYTTPLRFTNRLLVGPFDSEAQAQDFVNQLARRNVAAFAWTSPAGQEIEPLQ